MSSFQIFLLAIFGAATIAAVLVFSGAIDLPSFRSGGGGGIDELSGTVTIWGTLPQQPVNAALDEFNDNDDLTINYLHRDPGTFDEEITEALATGTGPDMFLLPDHNVLQNLQKVQPASFDVVSRKEYQDQFIQGADVFLNDNGIVAFPLIVDPLVLYYNRTLLENEGIALPPESWNELFSHVDQLTKRDENLRITQSTVPFGTYDNIERAKETIAMLFLQTGNPIVATEGTRSQAVLGVRQPGQAGGLEPTEAALKFYAEFADPVKDIYSWNTSFASARQEFLAGNLAYYFDYGSELFSIQSRNQNLNFTVTSVPQSASASSAITYGKFYGLALSRQAPNFNLASNLIFQLAYSEFPHMLAASLQMAPTQRSLLSQQPEDEYVRVFFRTALQARTWLDPNDEQTDEIFQAMLRDVTSGRKAYDQALNDANTRLNRTINNAL